MRKLCRILLVAVLPWSAPWAVQAQDAAVASCPPMAQMPTTAELQAQMRDAQDRGVLWRVEKGGRTSWLYGTIHVAESGWMVPGPTVMKALRASDALALELNVMDPAVVDELVSAMRAQPDAKPLPAALAERLEKLKQRECVGAETDALRPDAQVVTMAALIARREGLDPAYGVDVTLAGLASGMRKPVIGLESVQTQIREIVSDDPKEIEETVSTGLDQLEREDVGQTLATLARAWADGRLGLLESYPEWCNCLNTKTERREFERMVVGRNPGMARAITKELASGKQLFVAVGSLHMVGERGLPQLLARQGYKVERVDLSRPAD